MKTLGLARFILLLLVLAFIGKSYQAEAQTQVSTFQPLPTRDMTAVTNYYLGLITNGYAKIVLQEKYLVTVDYGTYKASYYVLARLKEKTMTFTNSGVEGVVLEAKTTAYALASEAGWLFKKSQTNEFNVSLEAMDSNGIVRYTIGAWFTLKNVNGNWQPDVGGDPINSLPGAVGTGDPFVRLYLPFDNIEGARLVLLGDDGEVTWWKDLPVNLFYLAFNRGGVNVKGKPYAYLPIGPDNLGPSASELWLDEALLDGKTKGMIEFQTTQGSTITYDLSGVRTNLSMKVFNTTVTGPTVTLSGGSAIVSGSISGAPGESAVVEQSMSLSGPWSPVTSFIVPASGGTNWTYTGSPSAGGYFRLRYR